MRCSFGYSLKEAIAAIVLSCFIAGGVGAVTGPSVADSSEILATSVNRTHKGDRLPQVALSHRQPNTSSSTQMAPASPKRTPLGCDPAFSPISAPALAHIFQRCMA
jgi:hypothetical protein